MTMRTGFTPIRAYAWVLLAVRALLALGLGIVVIATGQIRPGMVNVIAIYWLLGALLTLRWARAHPHARGQRLAYAASVGGIVASLVIFARGYLGGLLAEPHVLAVVGAFSIAIGVLRASGIFRESVTQAVRRSRPEVIVLGGLEIALGVVLILSTELRPIVAPMVGIWGLVGGSIMLADAIRAWRVLHRPSVEPAEAIGPEEGPNR